MEGYTPEDRELLREMRRVRRKMKALRLLWGTVVWAFVATAAAWFLMFRFFTLAVVSGPGMGETAPAGSVALVQRLRGDQAPERGDVILFEREEALEFKRVAAVGGDRVNQDENGRLTVNGEIVPGYNTPWTADLPEEPYTVPEGEYFVLGDRYDLSVDSRDPDFGTTIQKDSVIGAAKYIIWPAYRIGEIK